MIFGGRLMAKGGNFEREIAKILSLWWTSGEREDVFYRSHASGGRFTSRRKVGKDTALQGGDITASDPIGEPFVREFSIECKTGYSSGKTRWDILDFLDSKQSKPILKQFWDQCIQDAYDSGRKPLLIFRRNGRSPCIAFQTRLLREFVELFDTPQCVTAKVVGMNIMSLKDFLEWIPNIRSALCSKDCPSKTFKAIEKPSSNFVKGSMRSQGNRILVKRR
jgi:hypothetical protein